MPKLIERMHDWVVKLGASLAPGAILKTQIQIDSDAPFCLRSIATGPAESGNISQCKLRFSDQNSDWLWTEALFIGGGTGLSGAIPNNGLTGCQPVFPQEVYSPQAIMQIEVTNTGAAEIVNGAIYFRGVKLFEEGSILAPSYPPCYAERKYDYSPTPLVVTATQTILNNVLQIENDGDFALRALTIKEDASAAANYANLYARLRDRYGNYYQSDFMHVNVLFSRAFAERPGLVYPEIYLPRNAMLFYDVKRNDAAAGSSTTQFVFQGAKVFRQ